MPSDAFTVFFVVLFGLMGLIGLIIDCVMMVKDCPSILKGFENSQLFCKFRDNGCITGLAGRLQLVRCVSSVVVWSWIHIRKGNVDPQELEGLPIDIKRRAYYSSWLNQVCCAGFILLVLNLWTQEKMRDIFR